MTSFGMFLREHRWKLDLTQEDVASRVGVTQGQVSHWERDKKVPGYDEIKKLAEVLDIPLGQLLDRDLDLAKALQRAIVEDPYLSRKEQDMFLNLYETCTGHRAEIAKLLRGEWPLDEKQEEE